MHMNEGFSYSGLNEVMWCEVRIEVKPYDRSRCSEMEFATRRMACEHNALKRNFHFLCKSKQEGKCIVCYAQN
jgi:hypothetical protein